MAISGDALLQLLIEQTVEYAVIAMDTDGRVVQWNDGAARFFGHDAAAMTGQTLDRLFVPEDRAAGVPQLELARARDQGRAVDERWQLRADGARFWAMGVTVPVRDADGALLGFGKILRDRSDAKQRYDLLRRDAAHLADTEARRDMFLATLAHELRAPLSPLRFAASLLAGEAPVDRARIAAMIERQVGVLSRFADDLLDVTRLKWQQVELRLSRVEVNAAVAQAADSLADAVARRRHVLRVSAAAYALAVDADPERLHQILVNLIANAIKYTPDGGEINVQVNDENNEAVIDVCDTGIGLSPEDLARVFDAFTRAASGPGADDGANLGLGLAIVRDLARLHGGSVQARSRGIGLGACFTLRLPLAAAK